MSNQMNIWTIDGDKTEQAYLASLTNFMLEIFMEIFGFDRMMIEPCVIYNDPSAECPMLIINATPIRIRLAQSSLDFWAQTIFQLSHEMCHYALRQSKSDRTFTLKWFEEIVCEAVSLYALDYSTKNWNHCSLSRIVPDFDLSISGYLQNQLAQSGTDVFHGCKTIESLATYEQNLCYNRETHRSERNELYGVISLVPRNTRILGNYMDYLESNNLTIDFRRWLLDYPCSLLETLNDIQPVREI